MRMPSQPLDARVWAFLAAHRVARLATVAADGVPSIVPICYAGDGRALYSALDAKPKRVAPAKLQRVRNLLDRPDVALVVDEYAEDWSRLAYVLVRGRADLVEVGAPEHAAAVGLLRAKYPQYQGMPIEDHPVIRIRPVAAYLWAATPRATA